MQLQLERHHPFHIFLITFHEKNIRMFVSVFVSVLSSHPSKTLLHFRLFFSLRFDFRCSYWLFSFYSVFEYVSSHLCYLSAYLLFFPNILLILVSVLSFYLSSVFTFVHQVRSIQMFAFCSNEN